jgi:DNA invertase Pin-like site-specific DNA recombinase
MKQKPLIPLLRQSRAKEKTISIEEQRRHNEAWAKAHPDVLIGEEIIEQGVSGSRPWRERGVGEAIAMIGRGEASGILVAFQDRLSRESGLATAEVWDALDRAGARLVCSAEGLDTATGDHELTFAIKAAIARDQWKRHQKNWADARVNAIERGVVTHRTPFGYLKDSVTKLLILDPVKAPLVKALFEFKANGATQAACVAFMEEHGYDMAATTIRSMLENVCYLGVARSGEGNWNENAHPAIIGPDIFARVQASRGVPPTFKGNEPAMLKSLCRCANCDSTLLVKTDASGVTYYCYGRNQGGCTDRASTRVGALDAYLDAFVVATFDAHDTAFEAIAANERLIEADERLADVSKAFAEIKRDYLSMVAKYGIDSAREIMDQAEAAHGMAELERTNAANQASTIDGFSGTMSERWQTWDTEAKRSYLFGWIDHIEVKKGKEDVSLRTRIIGIDGTVLNHVSETAVEAV